VVKRNSPDTSSPLPPPSPFDPWLRFLVRFEPYAWDIGGVICLTIGLMTLLALVLPGLTSGLLSWWAWLLRLWFGLGGAWIVLAAIFIGVWMLRQRIRGYSHGIEWKRVFLSEALAFTSLAFLSMLGGASLDRAEAGLDGGRVGWGLAELLRLSLLSIGLSGIFWRILVLGILLVVFLIIALNLSKPLRRGFGWLSRAMTSSDVASYTNPAPTISESPLQGEMPSFKPAGAGRKKQPVLPPQFRKSFRLEPEESGPQATPPPRDDRLPNLDLLVYEQFNRPDERNINLTAGLIEKTLAEFGLPARVVGFRVGPTVTQFAVEPGYLEKDKPSTPDEQAENDSNRQKVRVAQISSLARDLTLALSAERLRIEAPVPGRPYVGIEVPNSRSSVVRLRPILETEAFYKVGSPLAIALGRDVSGQPVVADLARMPHLLIAGTTGSGKSVCIAALTTCLVMNNTPDDLRLVMVDPKMVELVRFNGLPHLYGKVETDLERILAVLRWTVAEMEQRYKILEASRSRNIDSYNRKARRRKGEKLLPHIVVLIDELADLMMSAPEQTEHNLVRLAQMARATGIHLVVATQRPGVDVVTGLIKANFPARISFAVASSVDSRVILDVNGAETLLGRGDMLYMPPETSGPLRLQGVMVSDPEVERVITFWQKAFSQQESESPPWEELIAQEEILADRDNLIEQAIDIVRRSQRASASMLQRRLRIGYPRAARLVDELEELGVIGPAVGGGRERDVLIEKTEEED
jgi:S-DNA-T family DNA segregation ATPase FtsK/SpoIIIE